MKKKEVQSRLEGLSEALVLTDATDLVALADIHGRFEQLASWAADSAVEDLERAFRRAAAVIEKIILDEIADKAAALETVGRALSAAQLVIHDGRKPAEVDFPRDLALLAGDETAAGAVPDEISLPANVDPAIFAEFLTRQQSVLEEMEALILSLEKAADAEKLGALRRLIHTMKGESALVGLSSVAQLCHAIEDALRTKAPARTTEILLRAKDWLQETFAACAEGRAAALPQDLVEQLTGTSDTTDVPDASAPEDAQTPCEPAHLEADANLLAEFVSEARDHLDASDVHLLTLESEPQNEEALNAVFRAFHTIKGVSGFLALREIQSLAHQAENLLDRARKGDLLLSGAAIDVTFDSLDAMKRMVGYVEQSLSTGEPLQREPELAQVMSRIKAVVSGDLPPEAASGDANRVPAGAKLGDILVESGAATREDLERAAREQSEIPSAEKLGEILVEYNVASRKQIEKALAAQRANPGGPRLGEILVASGIATAEDIQAALAKQASPHARKIGEILVREKAASAREVAHAVRTQKAAADRQGAEVKETLKIDADRLDRVVDAIGELVIAESMVTQTISSRSRNAAVLASQLAHLNKITRSLQEMSMALRMVPVRSTFQKMARIARDAAKKLGKDVAFGTSGDDTEIDKTLVDRIGDPLVHIVRNAIDHGIEPDAESRRRAGKSGTGQVRLSAYHKGGSICIEVQDDGRGLDRTRILAKARERGLTSDGDSLTDREVFNFLLQPGFSTAEKVTDMSGRGVGLDVVRRAVEALRGQIEIISDLGKGTTLIMRLPLTLAIIDGMVVRVGEERYIVPVLSIVTSLRPRPKDVSSVIGSGELLSVQGRLIPLFRLSRLYAISGARENPCEGLVVVVEEEGRRVGVLVDDLVAQQQIVIKSLGEYMSDVPGVSGAAIMPDGRVGLILDIAGIVKLATSSRVARGIVPAAEIVA